MQTLNPDSRLTTPVKETSSNKSILCEFSTMKKSTGFSPSRVVNSDYLLSLGDIYKCNICFNIMNNPADCDKCGHSYCLECISHLRCPFNCGSSMPKPSSVAIKMLLNGIVFRCENEGCEEKLTYNNVALHDQECECKSTKCPSPNCSLEIGKKNLEKHIKEECQFIYVPCKFCHLDFFRGEKEDHEESCQLVHLSLSKSAIKRVRKNNKSKIIGNGSQITNSELNDGLTNDTGNDTNPSPDDKCEGDQHFENDTNENDTNRTEHSHNNNSKALALNVVKYIETLNTNIAKIVNEQDARCKELDESSIQLKDNLAVTLKELIDGMKEVKVKQENLSESVSLAITQGISREENKNEIINNNSQSNNLNNFDPSSITKEIENIIKSSLIDVVEKHTTNNEALFNKLKKAIDLTSEKVISHLDAPKVGFDSISNTFSKTQADINEEPSPSTEELATLIVNSLKMSQDNIINSIGENKQDLLTYLTPKFNETDSKLEKLITNNDEQKEVLKNEIKNFKDDLIKNLTETIEKTEEERLNSMNEKVNLDINKISSNIVKNVIEIINDTNESSAEKISNELTAINTNIQEYNKVSANELETIKAEIGVISKKTKETSKIISEEFSDMSEKISEMSNVTSNYTKVTESIEVLETKVLSHIAAQTEQMNSTTANHLSAMSEKLSHLNVNISLEDTLNILEEKLITKIDKNLKEIYSLKWCGTCEAIDYSFGFLKCLICTKENCKGCLSLCKTCKTIFCKKCLKCTKCDNLCCLNCRVTCEFCSFTKGDKFCSLCMTECIHCKKSTCGDCIKQCISCKNMSCNDCSKFCRICSKSSCRRCETSKNFRKCCACNFISCIECVVTCVTCEGEVCRNCVLTCKKCKKYHCNKCGLNCGMCLDSYCGGCSKEFAQNKCAFCTSQFCTSCIKNFRKCKVCKQAVCKSCHAQCRKCKLYFCNNCNLNCDNCNEVTCSTCVYKCVCDSLIFCEKCLLDIHPIGPHDCVLWMNDSSFFTGIKTRSKLALPKNFEAKFFLSKFESDNLLIGLTDNNTFNEDTLSFVDNVWTFKVRSGQKYSSQKSLEPYYEKETREKDFVIVAVKNDNLYFRVNFDDNPPAYQLPSGREFFLYIENDSTNNFGNVKVHFVYIRKI